MKISNETLEILKNFASINSNILVHVGNTLKTVAPSKGILAEATVPEKFDKQFGIYDLTKLLGVISLFDQPDFDFGDACLFLKQGRRSVRYFYADPSLLSVPTKPLKMPDTPIEFTLSAEDFSEITKAANVLELPDLLVKNSDESGKIDLVVTDLGKTGKDSHSNKCTISVDGETDACKSATFSMHLKVHNLKFLPGEYKVGIAKKHIAQFKHTKRDIVYFVALDKETSYAD